MKEFGVEKLVRDAAAFLAFRWRQPDALPESGHLDVRAASKSNPIREDHDEDTDL